MTDRELLEQINTRVEQIDGNLTRLSSYIEKRFDNLDRRIDFLMEELVGVKIQTKSRLDRLEAGAE